MSENNLLSVVGISEVVAIKIMKTVSQLFCILAKPVTTTQNVQTNIKWLSKRNISEIFLNVSDQVTVQSLPEMSKRTFWWFESFAIANNVKKYGIHFFKLQALVDASQSISSVASSFLPIKQFLRVIIPYKCCACNYRNHHL